MKTPTHLNALRAFEATARLGSFRAAAEEIGVTPEAIGQLVRTLESYLEIQLFHRQRGGKRLTPTPEALTVLPSLTETFKNLLSITDRLKALSKTGILTLSTPPSVAAKWIVPILPSYIQEHPDIDVRLDMTNRVLDLASGEADIVIRYSDHHWPELNTMKLISDEKLLPVCSPELLSESPNITSIEGLLQQTLIHDATMTNPRYPGWRNWLQMMNFNAFDGAHFLEVNASLTAIEMAKMGQGITLAREHLIRNELAAGSLINLYPENPLSTHWNYYLVTTKNTTSEVEAFAKWLKEQLVF